MTEKQPINKNTYYMTPDWFIGACVSISRATSGKYLMTKKEQGQGFYLTLQVGPVALKVPFRALFDTNKKIAPSKALSFISALDCPSDRLGLCQLANSEKSCYAKNGAKQASGTFITSGQAKGAPCLNSYRNSRLVTSCIDLIKSDDALFHKLVKYINLNVKILRFNLKGDFRNLSDIKFLLRLASCAPRVLFYGYTARDDLFQVVKTYRMYSNFYLNGSNKKYTNHFKACYDLKAWLTSSKICLGGCQGCKKCYTLKNSTILCLVHGPSQDQDLNTWLNRVFLCDLFNSLNSSDSPTLEPEDLTIKKGLLESLNYQLNHKLGVTDLEFQDYWDLRDWLGGLTYEIWDNIEQVRDYEYLKSLGVA